MQVGTIRSNIMTSNLLRSEDDTETDLPNSKIYQIPTIPREARDVPKIEHECHEDRTLVCTVEHGRYNPQAPCDSVFRLFQTQ